MFSQSQLSIMIKLPHVKNNNLFDKISIYFAPSGLKEYVYSSSHNSKYFVTNGWKKVNIGCAPEHMHALPNTMCGKRLQYGLKHHVTATIHGCQGNTLPRLVTQISSSNSEYYIWDKAQVVVLLSRTHMAKDVIFVGEPQSTMNSLIQKTKTRSTQTNYLERIVSFISGESNLQHYPVFLYEDFPYDFSYVKLP